MFVLLCRPGRSGPNASGRGVLSMQGLSHGVVRVDNDDSLTSLTLQDCGQVLPGGNLFDELILCGQMLHTYTCLLDCMLMAL
jgi:hypothetical protein